MESCDASFSSGIVCELCSTNLAKDTGNCDYSALPSTYHAGKEGLGSVKVGEEVDSEVTVNFIQGKVEEGLAIDNGSIVDENRRCSKLSVISLIP